MGQNRTLKILKRSNKELHMRKFSEGAFPVDQIILPASMPYLQGINNVASVIMGTVNTTAGGGTTIPANPVGHIQSQNYGAGGTAHYLISDLGLDGDTPMKAIPFPYGDDPEKALGPPVPAGVANSVPETYPTWETSYADGIRVDGHNGRIQNCRIKNYRGNGIVYRITSNPATHGDATLPLIENCRINHCWTGIRTRYIDSQIYGCTVVDVRNYGWLDESGDSQTESNHFYGAQVAVQWGIDWDKPTQAWLIGSNKSVNDIFADAHFGLINWKSPRANVIGCRVHRCWEFGLYLYAPTRVVDAVVHVAQTDPDHNNMVGVRFEGADQTFTGQIELNKHKFSHAGPFGTSGTIRGMEIQHELHNVDTKIYYNSQLESGNQIGAVLKPANFDANVKINHSRMKFDLRGFYTSTPRANLGVVVESGALGVNNVLEIFGKDPPVGDTEKRLTLPTGWNSSGSNKVFLNGTQITAATYP